MKRRIYTKKTVKTEKRKELEQNLLQTLRDTRKTISPELLDMVRAATQKQVEEQQGQQVYKDFEPVDKRKMYETILRFIHLNKGKQDFMKQVMAIMQDAK